MGARLVRHVALVALVCILALFGCASPEGEAAQSESRMTEATPEEAFVRLQRAVEHKDASDQRLARALGRISAMVTPAQQQAFANAFGALPDVTTARADYHATAADLDAKLGRMLADDAARKAVMEARSGFWPFAPRVFGPKELFDAYALLAETPSASGALTFATRLLDHDPLLAAVNVDDHEVVTRLIVPALPAAFAEKLLGTGSTRSAVTEVSGILYRGGVGCSMIARWLERYQPLDGNNADVSRIEIAGRNMGEALRVVAGIIAIWELGGDLARGDIDAALQSFITAGPAALAGIATATAIYRRVMSGIASTPLANRVVQWSTRLGHGLSAVVMLWVLEQDLGHWDDSVSGKMRVVGDIVSLGASILMCLGTGPVGPVLAGIAIGIQIAASWIEDRAIEDQTDRDLVACLPATGLASPVLETLRKADPALVHILANDVKLSDADLQWLITIDPDAVVASPANIGMQFVGVQVAARIFLLDGAKTRQLFDAVASTSPTPEGKRALLESFFRSVEFDFSWNAGLDRTAALDWLDRAAAKASSDDEPAVRGIAIRNARAFLARP